MPESKKFIILPNGMRIQSDIAVKKSEKKQKIDEAPMGFVQSAESLGKLKYRVIAESKPLAKLPSSNIPRRNSDDLSSGGVQKSIVNDPGHDKPLQQKEAEVKQVPASNKLKKQKQNNNKKHKKNADSKPKQKINPRHLEIGSYVKLLPDEACLKILSKDGQGFFLEIPHGQPQFISYEYARKHSVSIVPKLHIEVLKKECNHFSDIADILLHESIQNSIEIIQANGYKPKYFSFMKEMFVPQILSESQWEQWKTRMGLALRLHNGIIEELKPQSEFIAEYVIKPQDFMVKVQNFNCVSKGHTLQPIQAEILCRSSNGKIINPILIPAGYCKQCKHYYILSSIYEEYFFSIKDAFCDFVSEENLPEFLQARSLQTREWCLQSDYNKCGYSVSREKNLSDDERIRILEVIIGYKIHSRQEVMSFLNWLIDLNKSNPLKAHAVQKWKLDLLGIANKNGPKVKPRLIKY